MAMNEPSHNHPLATSITVVVISGSALSFQGVTSPGYALQDLVIYEARWVRRAVRRGEPHGDSGKTRLQQEMYP